VNRGKRCGALGGAMLCVNVAGCSSAAKLSGQGGQCLTTDDCQMGLECLLDAGVCSNNLSSLVHTEEGAAPVDAPTSDVADAPADDALLDDGAAQQAPDAAPAEASSPPPAMESGTADASPSADATTD
jgi:hypothetical protein